MSENTNTNQAEHFRKQKNKEEMKRHVISFVLMIIFTIIAFAAVASGINKMFIVPILLLMALVQVAFQFYYFMHMKEKGHEMPATLIYGGVWAAFLTLAGLVAISWW
ncbi:cytochrome c oxidase subunit IVB [Virgibacillus sp. W0181]|uniref:cytochrome c oxidase subunit IVB n=1 Tax=Virgibacillus sp. W0181 TaxID=3391581 RepID=UPI003F465BD8